MSSACRAYNGTGTVEKVDDTIIWIQADPGVHASAEVIELDIFLEMYRVVGECPKIADVYHAQRR